MRHQPIRVTRRPFYVLFRPVTTFTAAGTAAAIQGSMNDTTQRTWHFTVNGVGACAAAETADPRLDPCTTCAHSTRESAEADAQRVRDLYPSADVRVHAGPCREPRDQYDYGYRDGYQAGLRAAAAAKSLPE